MKKINVKPGDVVVSNFAGYQHWSLVSDRVCQNNVPMLISASKRTGTVKEEPWYVATQGNLTYVAKRAASALDPSTALTVARSQIDQWKYSLFDRNCEHFVNWVATGKPKSSQVAAGIGGAALGAAGVYLIAEKPNGWKALLAAGLIAGLAVYGSKAIKNESSTTAT